MFPICVPVFTHCQCNRIPSGCRRKKVPSETCNVQAMPQLARNLTLNCCARKCTLNYAQTTQVKLRPFHHFFFSTEVKLRPRLSKPEGISPSAPLFDRRSQLHRHRLQNDEAYLGIFGALPRKPSYTFPSAHSQTF